MPNFWSVDLDAPASPEELARWAVCTCGHARSSHEWRLHSCRTCWRQVERGRRAAAAACCHFLPPAPPDALGATTITKPNSTGGLTSFRTRRYPGDDPSENG